jgi:hypothetical protein
VVANFGNTIAFLVCLVDVRIDIEVFTLDGELIVMVERQCFLPCMRVLGLHRFNGLPRLLGQIVSLLETGVYNLYVVL